MSKRCVAVLIAVFVVYSAAAARAEPSASHKAAAEALFQQGVRLVGEGRHAAACEKFAASQELDPALGTMLRLADCWDRVGKTASAWALFREAQSLAAGRGENDRERIASERAQHVEQRLSKLVVMVAERAPGLTFRIDGRVIPAASWDEEIPIDPGNHVLQASAPGRRDWSARVPVPDGPARVTVRVPKLPPAPVAAAHAAPRERAPRPRPRAPTQRYVGYGLVGAGGLSLAGSLVLGYVAYRTNEASRASCRADDPNVCSPDGVSEREDAQGYGTLATFSAIAGAALVTGGLVLVATAPGGQERQAVSVSGRGPGAEVQWRTVF